MAYDEGLAQRIREQLGDRRGLVEKKMFGGIAFLLRGNMCVGVHGDDLIVRLDPEQHAAALKKRGARVFDLTGRPMTGWLLVDGSAVEDDDDLASWIETAARYAGALPAKTTAAAKSRPEKPAAKPRWKKR